MILAADEHGGIGYKNGLPWPKISTDLKYFRKITQDNVVVMGSNTWRSLGIYAPLDMRINYVISSQNPFKFPNAYDIYDPTQETLEDILMSIEWRHPGREIFVIGGKTLYDATHHLCDKVYLTNVLGKYKCDTFCDVPEYLKGRSIISSVTEPGDQNTPTVQFTIWES